MPYPNATVESSEVGILNNQPELNFLQGMKFRFFIRKLPGVNYFVQRCNLPGMSISTPEQPTPLQNLPLPGTSLSYMDLVVTFRINADFSNYISLYKWLNGLAFPKDTYEYAELRNENTDLNAEFGGLFSDAVINVLDNYENSLLNIYYRDAFVTTLSDIYFDSTTADPNFLICTANFRYAWIDLESISPSGVATMIERDI
jgi:hypothetical protein